MILFSITNYELIIIFIREKYLRSPTVEDTKRILEDNALRGFPGMLGSIDCYNWVWKNCPKAWQGTYKGHKGISVILEGAVSQDLWFWHCYFGLPGSLNDINVLQRSPLLNQFTAGTAHHIEFILNEKTYTLPYWLADGIYPTWPVFAKTISDPQGAAQQYYAKMQESLRKDVERAFGVLQLRFAIVKNPARQWGKDRMTQIMKCCVIMHNMIIEDEREDPDLVDNTDFEPSLRTAQSSSVSSESFVKVSSAVLADVQSSVEETIAMVLKRVDTLRDPDAHLRLRRDLVKHLWNTKGNHVEY